MSKKLPPKQVRSELRKRGCGVRVWTKRGDKWFGAHSSFNIPRLVVVTAATTSTKAVIEVHERIMLFEVPL
jgi:hypothetical protein